MKKQKTYSDLIRKRNFVKNTVRKETSDAEPNSSFQSGAIRFPSISPSQSNANVIESQLSKIQKVFPECLHTF